MGIGATCALHFDRLGFRVFATVRREQDAENLKRQASERLTPVLCDVTDSAMIEDLRRTITRETGDAGLAGLVNNAGIACSSPLEIIPLDVFRMQFEVNVFGPLAITQALLPLLRQGRGRVVNMSSMSGRVTMPMLGAYAASKHALESLSDALRIELAPWGIPVSVIEPGAIATPIWTRSAVASKKCLEKIPEESVGLYAQLIHAMTRISAKAGEGAIPPERVARAVEHALTVKRPRTRYLVGRDAKLMAYLMQPLPDRLRDWIIIRMLHRYSH
jgi:NAD(P)-dependent dehydrogenase (short-subunit alcohol dehydrogenase family)